MSARSKLTAIFLSRTFQNKINIVYLAETVEILELLVDNLEIE